jgi:hypothetical protein
VTTYPFDPDWVVPTSEVLQEWLDERHLSTHVAAAARYRRGEPRDWAACVLNGVLGGKPLDDTDIGVLAAITGISEAFWRNFEHNYRAGLAAGKTVVRAGGSNGTS